MKSSKTTRRALLGSLTSLLLCFAMLIGSTFAWFTDTASTSVNTIQAGTLDVQLLDASNNSLEGTTLKWQKAEGHENDPVLWEPGCTYSLQPIVIKNGGDLALKYKIVITGIQGSAKLNEAIEWTVQVSANEANAEPYTTALGADHSLVAGASDTLTISGTMQTTAGNEYQGEKIEGIAITVYATQLNSEYDSTTKDYDANAEYLIPWDGSDADNSNVPETSQDGKIHVSTAAQLIAIMNTSQNENSAYLNQTIVLDASIDFGGRTIKGFGSEQSNFAGNFDGNGYTISNFKIEQDSIYAGLFNQFNGTVKNLTVKDATVKGTSMVGAIAANVEGNGAKMENCKAINCIVVGNQQVGSVTGYVATGAIVTGCRAEKCFVGYAANPEYQDSECQIVGYHNASSQGTVENNTYSDVTIVEGTVTLVSTAAELADAISNGGTIVLTKDIDMNNNWTTASVSNKGLTICGNGHTITKLNKPLVNFYGGTCTINDLTVKDSTVAANGDDTTSVLGAGIILEEAQWANLYMTNCHVKNSSVNVDGSNSRVGALVGYWIGGGEIKNCSVNSCTVYGAESAGGIVGHRQGQSAQGYEATAKVTGCTVSNTSVNSGRFAGAVLGRLSTEAFEINNCTYTGNAYGNIWDGSNGTVKIDGTTHNANG